tara:strand:+ start:1948 stop:2802 length:855 start_codon:yes stop_codon:yes gene_type:complete
MSKIKLSILIPLYNYKDGANKIINCLKNINEKESKEIEVIISDDSNKSLIRQDTQDLLNKKFYYFKYIFNKKKLGGVNNWNKLIRLSKGDYFWLLHHDEYWIKENFSIKNIIKKISKNDKSIFIIPIKKIFQIKKGCLNFLILQNHSGNKKLIQKFIMNRNYLIDINIIGPPSSLIISKKFKYLYDIRLKILVDVIYYIKLFEFVEFSNIEILSNKEYNIYSLQNNKYSITNSLKGKFYELKLREKKFIMGKEKDNFKQFIKKLIYFIRYKLYCISSTSIYKDK